MTPVNGRLLKVSGVSKSFASGDGPARHVLKDVSLECSAGTAVAVIGPSGSGKSTLLNIIGSLDSPDSGSVRLGDISVCELTGDGLTSYRAGEVGFVFQDHHLLPQLTARENVLLPSVAMHSAASAAERASGLMESVGLTHRDDAFPAQLSGGERQRVATARALINSPGLLLCDEPTGNLDSEAGSKVVELLLELARNDNTIVLMVTHNADHALRFDTVLELRSGALKTHSGGK